MRQSYRPIQPSSARQHYNLQRLELLRADFIHPSVLPPRGFTTGFILGAGVAHTRIPRLSTDGLPESEEQIRVFLHPLFYWGHHLTACSIGSTSRKLLSSLELPKGLPKFLWNPPLVLLCRLPGFLPENALSFQLPELNAAWSANPSDIFSLPRHLDLGFLTWMLKTLLTVNWEAIRTDSEIHLELMSLFIHLHQGIQLHSRWKSVESSTPLFTRVSKTHSWRSDDTKSIIDFLPRVSRPLLGTQRLESIFMERATEAPSPDHCFNSFVYTLFFLHHLAFLSSSPPPTHKCGKIFILGLGRVRY